MTAGIALAQDPSDLRAINALQQSLVRSIKRVEPSVVAIARVRRPENQADDPAVLGPLAIPQLFAEGDSPEHPDFVPNEFGAGVIIDAEGLILTTAHLMGDYQESDYYVWLQHRPFKAKIVAVDPWYDLAVLKIDASDLLPIKFGDGQRAKKGQIVVALGNPYSVARDGKASASWGIVSNLNRHAPRVPRAAPEPQGRPTLHHFGTLIQTDARLNIGYSGGALINLQGEMIGLTTSYAARAGSDKAAGFAIPIDENLRRVVELLKQGRKPEYGFLGVETEQLTADLRRTGQHGAVVRRVFPGTPADRAGLKAGDLITHIDDQQLFVTDDMIRLIAARSPDMPVVISVLRGYQSGRTTSRQLSAVLTKRFLRIVRPQYGTAPEPTWRGMRVDYATASPDFAALAATFDPANSLFVVDVAKESAAWNAGIRAGGYVTRVAGENVGDPRSFYALVADKETDVVLEMSTAQGSTRERTVSP